MASAPLEGAGAALQHGLQAFLGVLRGQQALGDCRQGAGCRQFTLVHHLARRGEGGADAQRRLGGDPLGQPEGTGHQFFAGQHLLHQAQAQGFVGVEFVAGEQPAHGVPQPATWGRRRVAPAKGKIPR